VLFSDVAGTVGKAPMVELPHISRGLPERIVAKLEMRNPCGSVKDRLGLALIEDAERSGRLKPGATIVDATGGNTGIGLAFVVAARGYRLLLTMPEIMSTERVALLRYLDSEQDVNDAVARSGDPTTADRGAVPSTALRTPAAQRLARTTTT
jgi:cysteine synthase A